MTKKKGFTLVELLAVIIILAIIALITIPAVMNVVTEAKNGAIKSSTYGYISAVEKDISLRDTNNKPAITPGEYTISDFPDIVKGTRPTAGIIIVGESGEIEEAQICIYDKLVSYSNQEVIIDHDNDCSSIAIASGFDYYDPSQTVITKKGELYLSGDYSILTKVTFPSSNTKIKSVVKGVLLVDDIEYAPSRKYALDTNNNVYLINYQLINYQDEPEYSIYGTEYLTGVKEIYYNNEAFYFLMTDGTVMSEGNSRGFGRAMAYGQTYEYPNLIGYVTTDFSEPLTTIPNLNNVNKLAVSDFSIYAILNDGTVKVWGANIGGATGNYTYPVAGYGYGVVPKEYSNTPVTITGLSNVKDIYTTVYPGNFIGPSYREFHPATYAIQNDGTVKVWGSHYHNQLGMGIVFEEDDIPFQELPVTNINMQNANNFRFLPAPDDAEFVHPYYLTKENGELYEWGAGNSSENPTIIPTLIATGFTFSSDMRGLIKNNGQIFVTELNDEMVIVQAALDYINTNGVDLASEYDMYEEFGVCFFLSLMEDEQATNNCIAASGIPGNELDFVINTVLSGYFNEVMMSLEDPTESVTIRDFEFTNGFYIENLSDKTIKDYYYMHDWSYGLNYFLTADGEIIISDKNGNIVLRTKDAATLAQFDRGIAE